MKEVTVWRWWLGAGVMSFDGVINGIYGAE